MKPSRVSASTSGNDATAPSMSASVVSPATNTNWSPGRGKFASNVSRLTITFPSTGSIFWTAVRVCRPATVRSRSRPSGPVSVKVSPTARPSSDA